MGSKSERRKQNSSAAQIAKLMVWGWLIGFLIAVIFASTVKAQECERWVQLDRQCRLTGQCLSEVEQARADCRAEAKTAERRVGLLSLEAGPTNGMPYVFYRRFVGDPQRVMHSGNPELFFECGRQEYPGEPRWCETHTIEECRTKFYWRPNFFCDDGRAWPCKRGSYPILCTRIEGEVAQPYWGIVGVD